MLAQLPPAPMADGEHVSELVHGNNGPEGGTAEAFFARPGSGKHMKRDTGTLLWPSALYLYHGVTCPVLHAQSGVYTFSLFFGQTMSPGPPFRTSKD